METFFYIDCRKNVYYNSLPFRSESELERNCKSENIFLHRGSTSHS